MAILTTEAVVLDRREYSNTSLILTFYTRLFGRISALAKGARRPKSGFQGTLDLLNYNEITFYRHTRTSLHTLSESSVKENFPEIRSDLQRTYNATYLAELTRMMTPEEEHHPEIFDLIIAAFREFNRKENSYRVLFQFEIKLLRLTGFQPELDHCVRCIDKTKDGNPFFNDQAGGLLCKQCATIYRKGDVRRTTAGAIATLRKLSTLDMKRGRTIGISKQMAVDIKRLLRPYILVRLEKEPRTFRYL